MVWLRFDAICVFTTSNGCPREVTSNMFIAAPTAMFDHENPDCAGAIVESWKDPFFVCRDGSPPPVDQLCDSCTSLHRIA